MRDITEEDVMKHAVEGNLVLWNQIHHLIKAVSECDKRTDEHRTFALAGRAQAIAIGMEALLNSSAKQLARERISEMTKLREVTHLEFDNVPKFGGSHANASN